MATLVFPTPLSLRLTQPREEDLVGVAVEDWGRVLPHSRLYQAAMCSARWRVEQRSANTRRREAPPKLSTSLRLTGRRMDDFLLHHKRPGVSAAPPMSAV